MSVRTTIITLGLVLLPPAASAHGFRLHTGFGFWHDVLHLVFYGVSAVLAGAAMIGVGVLIRSALRRKAVA